MGWNGMDYSGSVQGQAKGSGECDNEPSSYINCWEVLEWMHNSWLLE
jgi:hypothetical protein